jgi:hypothetical protein
MEESTKQKAESKKLLRRMIKANIISAKIIRLNSFLLSALRFQRA